MRRNSELRSMVKAPVETSLTRKATQRHALLVSGETSGDEKGLHSAERR